MRGGFGYRMEWVRSLGALVGWLARANGFLAMIKEG